MPPANERKSVAREALEHLEPAGVGSHSENIETAQHYLERFGYIDSLSYEPTVLDGATQEALERYQQWSRLPVTGSLDEETITAMQSPRCSMADPASPSILTRSSGAPKKWHQPLIRYSLALAPSLVDENETAEAVEAAMDVWRPHITAAIRQVGAFDPKDFEIRWIRPPDPDGQLGGGWAHSDYPPGSHGWEVSTTLPKAIHLDDDTYGWSATGPVDGVRYDITAAIAHEIGHMLGLPHTYNTNDVMDIRFDPRMGARQLTQGDIFRIRSLYGLT